MVFPEVDLAVNPAQTDFAAVDLIECDFSAFKAATLPAYMEVSCFICSSSWTFLIAWISSDRMLQSSSTIENFWIPSLSEMILIPVQVGSLATVDYDNTSLD